ncbi:MAG: hypothetical protein K0B87_03830 [Candidatus Syntrophosphaera sp.]|nr:hypothetical protein [Candidatus Syntrophosphaera sp.]
MISRIVVLVLACGIAASLGAANSKPFNYEAAWKEIDKLQSDGLPRSMGEKVDSLYAAALRENKTDQQIKALIYQLKIMQQVEEFSEQKAIEKVREQLQTAPHPASAILHSMLGQLYWSYYQSNRWRFGQRTETINFEPKDIATWDLKTITKEAISEYRLSLERSSELQKHSIADYPAVIAGGGAEERALRPTLYDFLAHRALEFYANDESGLTLPFDEFTLTDSKYFQPASSFAKMQIATPDTLSLKYQAIQLYQDLIRFHLEDADPAALVEVNLERLRFVYDNFALEVAEKHYESALRLEQSKYAGHPASASAAFRLAELVYELGSRYKPEFSEDYRWNFKNALEICREGVNAHPKSFGGRACAALADRIQTPSLDLTTESHVVPRAPVKALLRLANLSRVRVRAYRVPYASLEDDEYQENYYWQRDDYQKLKELARKKPLWEKTFELANEGDFRSHSYELPLTSFAAGNYVVIADSEDETPHGGKLLGFSLFSSTRISYLTRSMEQGSLLLLDRDSGAPLAGARVRTYSRDWDRSRSVYKYAQTWSGTSDAQGLVDLSGKETSWNTKMLITLGTDSLLVGNQYLGGRNQRSQISTTCLMFTDRAIYRPGQTIFVKGVLYETNGEKHNVLRPNTELEVIFYDVNSQIVAQERVRTNEYATFNTTFTAPKGVLTGNMYIATGYMTVPGKTAGSYSKVKVQGMISFSVEEYKRPRFEVKLDQPSATYKLEQYVSLKGSALSYAGFPIDNATVNFRITRQARYPWWFWWWGPSPATPQKEIARGTAVTDSGGEFSLTFLASGDPSVLTRFNPYFLFVITVDVTDISGETRSGLLRLSIGDQELLLDPVLGENIDLATQELLIPVRTTNLGGEPIPARGKVTISQLQAPGNIQKRRLWNSPDRNYLERGEFLKLFPNDIYAKEDNISAWKVLESVWSGTFATPDQDTLRIDNLRKWQPGAYVLEAIATYNQQEIKVTKYFTVYDSGAKNLPRPVAEWFVPIKTVCEPGEEAKILIGSGYDGVSLLMEVEKDHAIVESRRLSLDGEQKLIELPVVEADRGSYYVHFTFIRDGRLYSRTQEITVPWTNKQISFEYSTFRDKLLPGQEEEWRLKLKDHTGGKVTAEVLASMYDASLDAFRSSTWSVGFHGKVSRWGGWSNYAFVNPVNLITIHRQHYTPYPERHYDQLNWYGYSIGYYYGRMISYDLMMAMPEAAMMKDTVGSSREIEETAQSGVANEADMSFQSVAEAQVLPAEDLSGVQARVNFNETAFFYPELRTDENGEVSFVFTVPEALTKWKFRAFALSKDLQTGLTENGTVTQKPLMVLPNAPRFLREGDRLTFSAKITSLDETDLSGNCQLFLFDAITLEPVDALFKLRNAQQPFFVKKGESSSLSWDLEIPAGLGAVTYRVVARSGDFSDGEENTLPILTNRMLVTESLPLPVRGNTSKSFVFAKLRDSGDSATIRHHKLTLEYTSNPAWYAVQALPYLMEYPHDCNEQIFSRFYANSLASHIANSNPRIQRVFESWRDTPNSAALLSNLEKNQELKAVILQETPWVLDAKDESQAKQRIGLLFDLNNMANQYQTALLKLQQNQNPSGAWPWFPGMRDSWWVTQYIVEGFGHLDHLGVTAIREDSQVWEMLQAAIRYTDREILRDYENIKRYGRLEDDNLGYMELHYLYARSYFKDIRIPEDVNVAVDYFKGQSERYWLSKDLFGQGLIALALHRDGNKVIPGKIIASLKERALHDEELGMWWKNDNWGWFWYQAPIETQALLIEAFNDITGDTESIDGLRTWLLKNKQTTNWKTTKATASACYSLLLSGTEWLNTEQLAQITIGGEILDPTKLEGSQVEAGTGYFKTSWSGGEVTPQKAAVSVSNPNDVASWGSLYWQYFEDLDKITPAETPLSLKKQLFIERLTDTGRVLDPISDKTRLKVGDKVIVRIELRTDRDMEYVHLKDMRSAGFEPINVLSQYKWQDGLGYYEATGDASTNFFIEYLRKGTYVFEYPLRVFNAGDFSNGITSVQCMYAPEFSSHSEGIRVTVE